MWPNEDVENDIIFITFQLLCIMISSINLKNITFYLLALCWGKMFLSLHCGLNIVLKTNSNITLPWHFPSLKNDKEQEDGTKSSSIQESTEKFRRPSCKTDDVKSDDQGKKYPKQNQTHPGQPHLDIHLDGELQSNVEGNDCHRVLEDFVGAIMDESLQLMSLPFQGQTNPPDDIDMCYSILKQNNEMTIESIMQKLGSDKIFPSCVSLQDLQINQFEPNVTVYPTHVAATASFVIPEDTNIAFQVE